MRGNLAMDFEIGSEQTLARDIVEPATGDHPQFLMGRKGERVKIIGYDPNPVLYPYLVEGPTNPKKLWRANRVDFLTSDNAQNSSCEG